MLSAAAASKAATEASVGKAEAAEAWAEKAAAEPAIPASAKSDGNPDGIPIPMDNPIPTGYPSPIPTGGYPRPNSTVSTHCPTEGERALRGSADRSCPAPSVAAADAADRDKLGRFASLSAADNTSS